MCAVLCIGVGSGVMTLPDVQLGDFAIAAYITYTRLHVM